LRARRPDDASEKMLEKAKVKVENMKRIPVKVGKADAEKLQFDYETFDVVVDTFGFCSFVEPEKTLKEMSRVCKRGGEVRLLEHNMVDLNLDC